MENTMAEMTVLYDVRPSPGLSLLLLVDDKYVSENSL